MRAKRLTQLATSAFCIAIATSWAAAQGSAKVGCDADENGSRAAASFQALREGSQIARGICGKYVEVPPGPLTLVVTLDGVLAMGARRFEVDAKPGPPSRVTAHFETGILLVEVTRDGRRGSALVHLTAADGTTARTSAGVESRVGVGTYAVEVESRSERRRIEGVTIARGARQVLKVGFEAAPK
jgi:hypothetical protein